MSQLKEKIEKKVTKLRIADKVIFTGNRKDVNKLYSAMDVFCLPSFYEGMPVVAWEAQANGLPVVLSNRVPKEVGSNKNSFFLSLKAGEKYWTEVLFKNKSREKIDVPEIWKRTDWLEKVYKSLYKKGLIV